MDKTYGKILLICQFMLLILISFGYTMADEPVTLEEPETPGEKVYVDITVKAEVNNLLKGGEGEVFVSLIPRKGAKLNKVPPLFIAVDFPDVIQYEKKDAVLPDEKDRAKLDEVYFEKIMDPDADMSQFYFPDLKPFIFPFKLKKDLPPSLKLNVKVIYTYCTVKDGFCAPREKDFSIPITVKQTGKKNTGSGN